MFSGNDFFIDHLIIDHLPFEPNTVRHAAFDAVSPTKRLYCYAIAGQARNDEALPFNRLCNAKNRNANPNTRDCRITTNGQRELNAARRNNSPPAPSGGGERGKES